jgi:hypothetical protein
MLLEILKARGWNVQVSKGNAPLLPPSVAARYPTLPFDLVAFLSSIDLCVNSAENSWFLTAEDYRREAGPLHRWNEYEIMSIESCRTEEEREDVTAFWDVHFPFLLAVHSDYDYLGVALTGESYGRIVHGYAPSWEEPTVIAQSFGEFLRRFGDAATTEEPPWPECLFL